MTASYRDPQALRRAITDRLRTYAGGRGDLDLPDLQRQLAYDRLLCRLFTAVDGDRWVLKGATALLARLGGTARHTVDVDLYRQVGDLREAEASLRLASAADLGDYFAFSLSPGRRVAQEGVALRVPVTAYLGAVEFARFHVDLVSGRLMTGTPDQVDPLVPIDLPGIRRTPYRVYPLVDHVADKVHALLELHPRVGRPPVASTRYRDLADLAVIAHSESIDAGALSRALQAHAARRRLRLPSALRPPADPAWPAGYSRVARDVPGLVDRDVAAATATVGRFIDPVLADEAAGRWNPRALRWE
jgi:Nucleotidyl transferase AbiEii toxin, Type IV TA system